LWLLLLSPRPSSEGSLRVRWLLLCRMPAPTPALPLLQANFPAGSVPLSGDSGAPAAAPSAPAAGAWRGLAPAHAAAPGAGVAPSEARLLLLPMLRSEPQGLFRPLMTCPADSSAACVGLWQLCCCAMCCMAANFARSLRAAAPMERCDHSWLAVLRLLLKLSRWLDSWVGRRRARAG
jgi:hypothetical protein